MNLQKGLLKLASGNDGFRGEFITKALLLMAMEDALAHNDERPENGLANWTPISIDAFLSCLLRYDHEDEPNSSPFPEGTRTDSAALTDDAEDQYAGEESPRQNSSTVNVSSPSFSDPQQQHFDDWNDYEEDVPLHASADGHPQWEGLPLFSSLAEKMLKPKPARQSARLNRGQHLRNA